MRKKRLINMRNRPQNEKKVTEYIISRKCKFILEKIKFFKRNENILIFFHRMNSNYSD